MRQQRERVQVMYSATPEAPLEHVVMSNQSAAFISFDFISQWPSKSSWRNFTLPAWHLSQMADSGYFVQNQDRMLIIHVIDQYRRAYALCTN